jgi:vanillate O-demethylase monooxygenase subunit
VTFLKNAWYVAGFADEVVRGKMLARRLLDEPVVFFRQPDGRIAALHDRCPHRFAPLSTGQLMDDGAAVACGYHGLQYDARGQCVLNPHGDGRVPAAARVRSYAAVERDGLLWWWGGDAQLADESLIPNYRPATGGVPDATMRGYLHTACDYRLVIENILDLTHADFVHAGLLGSGAITRTTPTFDDLGPRSVRISWIAHGEAAPPFFDACLKRQGEPTDQWTIVTWNAPSSIIMQVGATLQGEPREEGIDSYAIHCVTPETEHTAHYWHWSDRTFAVNPEANAAMSKMLDYAFSQQDKPMIEAQYRNMAGADFWSLKPVLLPTDAAAVQFRRRLDALIAGVPQGSTQPQRASSPA